MLNFMLLYISLPLILSIQDTPFAQTVTSVKNFLWDNILLFALLGIGIYLSITLKFPQVKYLGGTLNKMIGGIIHKEEAKPGTMTPFQSLATAIASQVGTGNIIGVATALAAGGPGAGFWMLVSAFFGMATIFAEAVLAQLYRQDIRGEKVGGPAYYLQNGLHSKVLSHIFALFCIIGLGIVGVMVQSSSVVESINVSFGFGKSWVTVALAVIVSLILAGGMGRIAKFSETIVPVMAFAYVLASLIIILMNLTLLPTVLWSIVKGAFTPQAIAGGALGISMREAMRFGIARGLFSNEAGMGSTPHSHAAAEVDHPAEQGLNAMIGVFISTFLICLSTAMVNLQSGSYNPNIPASEMSKMADLMTQNAFQISFGKFGSAFLSIALSCFALTTIIGWYFFAEANVKFIYKDSRLAVSLFRAVSIGFLLVGPLIGGEFVWTLADLFMGLMALPNVVGLAALNRQTRFVLQDYLDQQKQGKKLSWQGLPAELGGTKEKTN